MAKVGNSRVCHITPVRHKDRVQAQIVNQDSLFMYVLNTLRQLMGQLPRPILLQQIVPLTKVPSQRAATLPLQHQLVLCGAPKRIEHPHDVVVHAHPHQMYLVFDCGCLAIVFIMK